MIDTLETAAEDGMAVGGSEIHSPFTESVSLTETVDDWRRLTAAMNDLNRSLGLDDAYPFAMQPGVVEKVRFVHGLVVASRQP